MLHLQQEHPVGIPLFGGGVLSVRARNHTRLLTHPLITPSTTILGAENQFLFSQKPPDSTKSLTFWRFANPPSKGYSANISWRVPSALLSLLTCSPFYSLQISVHLLQHLFDRLQCHLFTCLYQQILIHFHFHSLFFLWL